MLSSRLVRMRGVEPPQGFPYHHLKVARLPFRHIRMRQVAANRDQWT